MRELENNEIYNVEGGMALLLGGLTFVYYERENISDFFSGFYEGFYDNQVPHMAR